MMQLAIGRGEEKIYQGQWQPLAPLVVKKDRVGIEIGGQFKLALPPGVYELTIAVKDPKSKQPIERTVVFAVES